MMSALDLVLADAALVASLLPAAIALVGTLIVAAFGIRERKRLAADQAETTKQVETLRAELAEPGARASARVEYEYDARKRLYAAYEPLRVRLVDAGEFAVRQVLDIMRRSALGATTDSSPQYPVAAAVYYLAGPLAVARLIEQRLMLVDLQLSPEAHREFVLARVLYRTFADDGGLARVTPPLVYTPYVEGWRDKRQECPQRFRRQGLPRGRLDTAIDVLRVDDPSGAERLATFGELGERLAAVKDGDVRSGAGALRDLFVDFGPRTRPVLWRVLLAELVLLWCFREAVYARALVPAQDQLAAAFLDSDVGRQLSDAAGTPGLELPESLDESIRAAASYISGCIAPGLARAERLANSASELT